MNDMPISSSNEYLVNREAAEMSGYSPDYLARLYREGKVEATKRERTWLVKRQSLESFMRSQEQKKKEMPQGLANTREQHHKAATHMASPLVTEGPGVNEMAIPKHRTSRLAYGSPTLSEVHPMLRQGFALAVTVLVLSASVGIGQSGIIDSVAQRLVASAVAAHAGERDLPEQSVLAVYRLGDMLSHAAAVQTEAAPRVYKEGVLTLLGAARTMAAAVTALPDFSYRVFRNFSH